MFGFGKKDQTESALETLHQAHMNLFLKIRDQVTVGTVEFGLLIGCLEGANQMTGYLITTLDSIKDGFGKGTIDKAENLLKILTLKMAYTVMWIDNDTRAILENPAELEASQRGEYLLSSNRLLPAQTVIDLLCEPSERTQMAAEFLILESYHSDRMRETSDRAELILLNMKMVSIVNSKDMDLRNFNKVSSDPIDNIFNSELLPLSITDRITIQQAEEEATNAMLEVFNGTF